jgi:hypothetical protein
VLLVVELAVEGLALAEGGSSRPPALFDLA